MKRAIPVRVVLVALLACAATLPARAETAPVAVSASRDDTWQFGALLYLWAAGIGGKTTFPNGQSASVTIDANQLFNNLKFAALGSFDARKGQWGVFTDLIYMNVGASKSQVRDFEIGRVGLPADVTAYAHFGMESLVWTLAGTYRIPTRQGVVLDTFAGGRLLDIKQSLNWTLNGNIVQFPLAERAGAVSGRNTYVDGIVGLKGRVSFGDQLRWFVPYYADVGTGQSSLTWQAMAGLGYSYNWGEIVAAWRYIDYQFKSDSPIDSLNFNGPLVGFAWHW